MVALRIQREIDHHNAVLFDNADQKHETDDGNDAEILAEKDKREKSPNTGRRKRGKNRDRMDEALIQDAEDDVNGNESGEDEQRHVGQRISEGCGGALEIGLQPRRHVHILLHFGDSRNCSAERGVGGQIEGNRNRRKLSLMVDRELFGSCFKMRERPERHRIARCRTGGSRG